MAKINVTIWNEFVHEVEHEPVKKVYPDGIHNTLARGLGKLGDFNIRTATLTEKDHGLSDEVIKTTDVMLWWGHMAHDRVSDETVEKVYLQVLSGMGLIVLHSGHYSKIFKRLMGTFCSLKCLRTPSWKAFLNILNFRKRKCTASGLIFPRLKKS
jgi:trehalose utilization protein